MTMKKSEVPLRISRWAMMLQDFDYEIEHRSGSKMRHVDALSRVSCLLIEESLRHRLKEAQLNDGHIKALRKILEVNQYEDYYVHHDILFKDPKKELLVVPTQMENEIIMIAHTKGHFGAKNARLRGKVFLYSGLAAKIPQVIGSCVECLVVNAKLGKKEGLCSNRQGR
ncbi:Transposon Tf2-8 polyprotein [Eumeta japonica]|uniref:Transposon Tf2-8 polyprotein n=1 Tax=Eumeta variegata TaxID=151549 RepID=A0A4C1SX27_EUMVA|nr:Transposon Tf2-8 polyprotein [Eumeta japonica]